MHRFWKPIIKPLFDSILPRDILEIGSGSGLNTQNLIEYSKENNCFVHTIDPTPDFAAVEWEKSKQGLLKIYIETSLNALPHIEKYDVVLIDGDHNWYTVFNELQLIESSALKRGSNFPLVLLHDVCWPYGRRDLYYDPDTIPEKFRKPYIKQGIIPGCATTIKAGGLNYHLYNAVSECGSHNGVLTAIEDFLSQTKLSLKLEIIPILHGLGILYPQSLSNNKAFCNVMKSFCFSDNTGLFKLMEDQRIETLIKVTDQQAGYKSDLAELIQQEKSYKQQIEELKQQIKELKQYTQLYEVQLDEKSIALSEAKQLQLKLRKELVAKMRVASAWENLTHQYEIGLDKLQDTLNAFLHSNRWKIGNTAVNAINRLFLRKTEAIAVKDMQEIFTASKNWKKEVINSSEKLRTSIFYNGIKNQPKINYRNSLLLRFPEAPIGKIKNIPEVHFPVLSEDAVKALSSMERVSIVIPVYNSFNDLKACVESIIRHTHCSFEVVIVDDASTDDRFNAYYESLLKDDNFKVLRNTKNIGFVASANLGLRTTKLDVVLLNSDTVVTPRWLTKLRMAAYSKSNVATATPFSNAAGAFSVPEIGINKPLPIHLSVEDMGRLVERITRHVYPEVPTGNGFCMYIRRDALKVTGFFNEEAFGRGYGEENDLCMRFIQHGFINVIDDATFIYHSGNASFGIEKEVLAKKNRETLNQMHPEYTSLVKKFVNSAQIRQIRCKIGEEIAIDNPWTDYEKQRVLYVLHHGGGGVPHTSLDLITALADKYQCFMLTSDANQIRLFLYSLENLVEIMVWPLKKVWNPTEFFNADFLSIYRQILFSIKPDIVHIRHLFKHTLDIFTACQEMATKVIFSFHDFYTINPFIHLLDSNGVFHPEPDPSDKIHWNVPSPLLSPCPQNQLFLNKWKKEFQTALCLCSAFVTTSHVVREIFYKHIPFLKQHNFRIIEHGRDFSAIENSVAPPKPDEKIKILLLGNMDFHKGSDLIKSIDKIDKAGKNKLEFHFCGTIDRKLENVGVKYGAYNRNQVFDYIKKIQPHFVAQMTICCETFSHTLTEAWAAGVPVLGTPLGGVGERICESKGGWIIDISDPKNAYNQILNISADKKDYNNKVQAIKEMHLKTSLEMASEYDFLYRETMLPKTQKTLYKLCVFIPKGYHGSSYIRTILPLNHVSVKDKIYPFFFDHGDHGHEMSALEAFMQKIGINAVYVQRESFDNDKVDWIISYARRNKIRLFLDLDDDLFKIPDKHPGNRLNKKQIMPLQRYAIASNCIFVSTEKLRQKIEKLSNNIIKVPNALDEKLWFAPLPSRNGCRNDNDRRDTDVNDVRILYMGTFTHDQDMEMVIPALKEAASRLQKSKGISLKVHLVGITIRNNLDPIFVRIKMPGKILYYPFFVKWLRTINTWDMAIAPLVDKPFNHAKSDIKFLEYSALGLPGIYSPVGDYLNSVKHGVTGLICRDNNPKEWTDHIISLCSNENLRRSISFEALDWVKKNRLMNKIAPDLSYQFEK